MEDRYFIKGQSYIDKKLFPCYINNFHEQDDKHVGVQRYNSKTWYSEIRIANSSEHILSKIILCDDENEEDINNSYYNNFQLITDLFDIIITKQSDFRESEEDCILRKNFDTISFDTQNRYTTKFLDMKLFNNKDIVLVSNPPSQSSRSLVKKRKKLNECL